MLLIGFDSRTEVDLTDNEACGVVLVNQQIRSTDAGLTETDVPHPKWKGV